MREHTPEFVGVGLLFVLALLAKHRRVRRVAGDVLRRLGARLLDFLNPPPEFDHIADDLSKALRRERLRADVRRLERILATDMSMSATRQIGNRLAYGWLVRELDLSTSGLSPWLSDDATSVQVLGLPSLTSVSTSVAGQDRRHAPKVETLTIGWKH